MERIMYSRTRFFALAEPMSSFLGHLSRAFIVARLQKKKKKKKGKKTHLALLHSFFIKVKRLFSLEKFAKAMERNHILALAAGFPMGTDQP